MRRLFVIFLLLISTSSPAQTLLLCIGNVSQFASAIDAAAGNDPGFDRVIARVRTGTYDLSGSTAFSGNNVARLINKDLVISGGYNSDCSARSLNSFNTIVRNTTATRGLFLAPVGDLTMQGLSFDNFEGNLGTRVTSTVDVLTRIEFSNNRVFGGEGNFELNAESGSGTSLLILKNNEFGGRVSAVCPIDLSGDSGAGTEVRLIMANNVISLNTSDTLRGAVCVRHFEQPGFYNNIFFVNVGGSDLHGISNVAPISTRNNIIEATTNLTTGSSSGNLNVNPQFLNALSGDFRVQSTSPAINFGEDAVPTGAGASDILGGPRIVGVAIDRGAHESIITGTTDILTTSISGSGVGSLRSAIVAANSSPGFNRIAFNISGGCPRVINLNSLLPDISDSLTIDGTTQPGYVPNTNDLSYNGTRCVLLKPAAGLLQTGLRVPAVASSSVRLVVDSLIFGGFGYAVRLDGGRAHQFVGSQFGGNANAMANEGGIWVADADDVQIGGSEFSQLNTFADSSGADGVASAGILLGAASERAEVIRNFIGFGANGVLEGGNDFGIHVLGNSRVIDQNLIGNNTVGLFFGSDAANNSLTGNRIGVPAFCFVPPCAGSGNLIGVRILGHDNALVSNLTAFYSGPGVRVEGNSNPIIDHSSHSNGDGSLLVPPIDIASAGFTANDNDAVANPPNGNRGQNFPAIVSVNFNQAGALATVQGGLNSRNGRYRISVYAGDRVLDLARCESTRSLWSGDIEITNGSANTNGSGAFFAQVLKTLAFGKQLSATATRVEVLTQGTDFTDTSEIGPCFAAPLFLDGFE